MRLARAPPGHTPDASAQSTTPCALGRNRVRAEFLFSHDKEHETICDSKAQR
jgi:hypothetical protein